jgi:hypothetical protein
MGEASVHGFVALKAFGVAVTAWRQLTVLVTVAGVASVVDDAVILMARRAGLPAVRSHVQFNSLIRMAILAQGLRDIMLESCRMSVVAVYAKRIGVVVSVTVTSGAVHNQN